MNSLTNIARIVSLLLRLEAFASDYSYDQIFAYWRSQIRLNRQHLDRRLRAQPDLLLILQEGLPDALIKSRKLAAKKIHPSQLGRLPEAASYTWAQISGDWMPS